MTAALTIIAPNGQSVEVYSGCDPVRTIIAAIPLLLMASRRLRFVNESSNKVALNIVNVKPDG